MIFYFPSEEVSVMKYLNVSMPLIAFLLNALYRYKYIVSLIR